MSGLKPGPISGARATAEARANAATNTGVSPLRCASVEITLGRCGGLGAEAGGRKNQIPKENDRKKGKGERRVRGKEGQE
jgi:hypothetical protein